MKKTLLVFNSSSRRTLGSVNPDFLRTYSIISDILPVANVSVLFIGTSGLEEYREALKKHFGREIEVIRLPETVGQTAATLGFDLKDYRTFVSESLRLYEFLLQMDYDVVIFDLYGASGFLPIRAKRTGQGLVDTVLVSWIRDCHEFRISQALKAPEDFDPFMISQHMYFSEKYSFENCDLVLAHTQSILDWVTTENNWAVNKSNTIRLSDPVAFQELFSGERDNNGQAVLSDSGCIISNSKPRVSVCMAHYNDGTKLMYALNSLEQNDYENFEVIVVDDGSTDVESRAKFEVLASRYEGLGWSFISKARNEGPGPARNFAVSLATGEYIIFMDSDNLAAHSMISDFVLGMEVSSAHCLSCGMIIFEGESEQPSGSDVKEIWIPLGAALKLGYFDNIVGDTNFCVKKSVFESLGGFSNTLDFLEDWDFLTGLVLAGYKLEVVPKGLYYYRQSGASKSDSTWSGNSIKALRERFLSRCLHGNENLVHELLLEEMAENERLRSSVWKLDRKIVKLALRLSEVLTEERRNRAQTALNNILGSLLGNRLIGKFRQLVPGTRNRPVKNATVELVKVNRAGASTGQAEVSVMRSQIGTPPSAPVFMFLGKLVDSDNPLGFLRLAYWVQMSGDDSFFLMVGDGPMKDDVIRTSHISGLKNFRLVSEDLSHEDFYDVVSGFIITGQNRDLSNQLTSVLSKSIPVFSRDGEVSRELVENGTNGLIVDHDPEKKDFADCFRRWKSAIGVYREGARECSRLME